MFYKLYTTYVWSCEKMKFPCFIHCTRHMYDHVRKWSSHVLYTVHDICMIMWENEVPMFYTLYTTYVWSCEKIKFPCFINCTRHMYDHVRKWSSHVLYTVHDTCMIMWENEVPMFYTLYTTHVWSCEKMKFPCFIHCTRHMYDHVRKWSSHVLYTVHDTCMIMWENEVPMFYTLYTTHVWSCEKMKFPCFIHCTRHMYDHVRKWSSHVLYTVHDICMIMWENEVPMFYTLYTTHVWSCEKMNFPCFIHCTWHMYDHVRKWSSHVLYTVHDTCMIMWENEVPMFYTLYTTYVWSCEKMKFPCFIHCTRHMYDHVRKWSSHVLYTVHDTCMIMWENEVPMFYTLYTTHVWSCEKMKFPCFIHCTRHMYDHVRKWSSHVLYTVHDICMIMWENEVPMFYTLYTTHVWSCEKMKFPCFIHCTRHMYDHVRKWSSHVLYTVHDTCMIMWENEVPMFYTLYTTYVWSCEKMKFPCFIHCTRHMYDHVRKLSSHVL